ncbi:hypothetical protein QAD02_005821 [Eretmocerus hayati]|uniref:Uncharacterized protein n=1 Tax=Eretmocerus hayati TaxID=131215 RepID=A0ACC2NTI6_9HYME|nr:hypothetical protein QAD02_005821 [Eretmocerus hayati]
MLLCIIQLILVAPLVFGLYMGRLSLLEGYPEKDKLDEAEGLDDMYRAVEQLNTVLDLEFLVSREPYQKTPEFERFSDSLTDLLIPLQTIDQYFKDALWCQEVLRTKNTGELRRVELFAAAINVNYETETPLDKISSVVNENFFKQLQVE